MASQANIQLLQHVLQDAGAVAEEWKKSDGPVTTHDLDELFGNALFSEDSPSLTCIRETLRGAHMDLDELVEPVLKFVHTNWTVLIKAVKTFSHSPRWSQAKQRKAIHNFLTQSPLEPSHLTLLVVSCFVLASHARFVVNEDVDMTCPSILSANIESSTPGNPSVLGDEEKRQESTGENDESSTPGNLDCPMLVDREFTTRGNVECSETVSGSNDELEIEEVHHSPAAQDSDETEMEDVHHSRGEETDEVEMVEVRCSPVVDASDEMEMEDVEESDMENNARRREFAAFNEVLSDRDVDSDQDVVPAEHAPPCPPATHVLTQLNFPDSSKERASSGRVRNWSTNAPQDGCLRLFVECIGTLFLRLIARHLFSKVAPQLVRQFAEIVEMEETITSKRMTELVCAFVCVSFQSEGLVFLAAKGVCTPDGATRRFVSVVPGLVAQWAIIPGRSP